VLSRVGLACFTGTFEGAASSCRASNFTPDTPLTIVERLGIEYRRSTLTEWDNGQRLITPAEDMASAWQTLADRVAADFNAFSR